jgi:hypothetical protein
MPRHHEMKDMHGGSLTSLLRMPFAVSATLYAKWWLCRC